MALDMERIEAGENLTTEFKREYTEDIKKTIVAFANTAGGTLYIGINDDKTAAGVDNPDNTLLQVSNAVHSAIKPDLTLFVDYKTEKMGDAAVIAVTVQRGTSCPYYLAGKGIRPEGVYVRHGASSVPASESAILNMIKETDGEKYEELQSLNQDLTFREAEEFFEAENVPFGLNEKKTLHLQNTDGIYTNLGLLLSDQSVHTVKMAVFEGQEKEVFKDRREISGSLLKQLEETYAFLDVYNRTHAEVKGLARVDKRNYPEEALREALLNALVHRDYAFSSSTLVSVFDDRMEFVSIGGLPKGVSLDDIMLGLSVPRNEKLAAVFYRLRLIEAYGTGIPKIMRSYAGGRRKPELQVTGNAFKITLPNRNVNYAGINGNNEEAITEDEAKIIALVDLRGEITRKDVEAALSVSQAMAGRLLRALADKGAVRVIGGGKRTRYRK
ncbi:MAG: putative DNA binding domain-containing protein [Treponema sp.]|jgi:ATP-dependent DNA helicase RecG|nr:putative DNA binding domain-containing protein [Treponema sp.]